MFSLPKLLIAQWRCQEFTLGGPHRRGGVRGVGPQKERSPGAPPETFLKFEWSQTLF